MENTWVLTLFLPQSRLLCASSYQKCPLDVISSKRLKLYAVPQLSVDCNAKEPNDCQKINTSGKRLKVVVIRTFWILIEKSMECSRMDCGFRARRLQWSFAPSKVLGNLKCPFPFGANRTGISTRNNPGKAENALTHAAKTGIKYKLVNF